MIEVMALEILHNISSKIQSAKHFTIMADETVDTLNQEQVAICLWWIDRDTLMAQEEFVAMKPMECCITDILVQVIKTCLLKLI